MSFQRFWGSFFQIRIFGNRYLFVFRSQMTAARTNNTSFNENLAIGVGKQDFLLCGRAQI